MSRQLPKVVVIHPDRQHSLQTALALQNKELLYKYFTTVYLKKHSISSVLASIAPENIRKKFLKHKLEGLDESKVHMFCQKRMLLLSLVSRFLSENIVNMCRLRIIQAFNKKCLAVCLKHEIDVLISYDTLSGATYKELKNKGVKLILDMSAPFYKEMYHNFHIDVKKNPSDSKVLDNYLKSRKVRWNLECCQKEIDTYDFFLSASSYTRDTLINNNIDNSRILVAPYGLTQVRNPKKEEHEGFSCTFIGSVTQQKGCHYIFRIAKMMPDVNFHLIGVYDNSYSNIPNNCILHGYLTFNEIVDVLQKTDLFLFLSLADGFGFAATEAMAYGIPVVCSNRAGVRDLVKSNGWIVDPTQVDCLVEIIKWCIENPNDLENRGVKARAAVSNKGWDNYGKILSDFIQRI